MSKLFLAFFILGALLVIAEAWPRGRGWGRGRGNGHGHAVMERVLGRDIPSDVGRGFRRWMRRFVSFAYILHCATHQIADTANALNVINRIQISQKCHLSFKIALNTLK